MCRRKANTTPKFTPKKKNPSLGTSVAKYPIKQEIIIEKTQADHYYWKSWLSLNTKLVNIYKENNKVTNNVPINMVGNNNLNPNRAMTTPTTIMIIPKNIKWFYIKTNKTLPANVGHAY